MSKKRYAATKKVREFIASQPDEVQAEYVKLVERLERDGHLIEPFGKKLDRDLFEMRIRRGRQVRVIYVYLADPWVVGVHAFVKKSQHTPLQELAQARRVQRQIEEGHHENDE